MKSLRPIHMVFLAAGSVAVVVFCALVGMKVFFNPEINNSSIVLLTILVFTISHFVFYFTLEKYIYRKIKLIYKSIYELKSTKKSKDKIRLQDDVIGDVEKEVNRWAENKRDEIHKLKKMETYRRDFLGNVSHELKTPIFNVQGYLETLVYGGVYDDKINIKYLKKAIENVERLGIIVSDLETISAMESDVMSLYYERFDILVLTKEILATFELQSQEQNIALMLTDERTPRFVYADKNRIQQVIINLISNSIKYGKDGGTTKISFFDMDENLLIEISDNGIGIEKKHVKRLFERFYRVDTNRSRQQGGSGLGLAIVKHIIEAHHQTINIRSTPKIGSTFGFTLKKG